MEIRAQSIDYAAGGMLRHRFLRAVAAAIAVVLVLGLAVAAVIGGGVAAGNVLGRTLTEIGVAAVASAAMFGLLWFGGLRLRRELAPFTSAMRLDFLQRNWRPALLRLGGLLAGAAIALAAVVIGVVQAWTLARFLLLVAVIAPLFLIALAVATLITGGLIALVQALHRRLAALAFFAIAASACAALVLNTGNKLGGDDVLDTILAIVSIGVALIFFELLGQAWWQASASADGFAAARGWRPPLRRLLTVTRRHLGLPGFLANFSKGRVRISALYFAVSALNSAILLLIAVPIMLMFPMSYGGNSLLDWIKLVGATFAALALAYGCLRLAAYLLRLAEQRTTELYQGVREWDARAPVVFLRAFDQDSAKLRARSIDPILRWVAGVARPQTLDEILLEHASPYGPVIAIGDPRTTTPPLGAARIFVREQGNGWQDLVNGLVTASKAVVITPTTTEGVRWELELVNRHDVFARTIYLANPSISDDENKLLFEAMLPPGYTLVMKKRNTPIAAFHDADKGFRVLVARRRSLQTYIVALNFALQSLHGRKGVEPVRVRKPKPEKKPRRPRGDRGAATPAVAEATPAA